MTLSGSTSTQARYRLNSMMRRHTMPARRPRKRPIILAALIALPCSPPRGPRTAPSSSATCACSTPPPTSLSSLRSRSALRRANAWGLWAVRVQASRASPSPSSVPWSSRAARSPSMASITATSTSVGFAARCPSYSKSPSSSRAPCATIWRRWASTPTRSFGTPSSARVWHPRSVHLLGAWRSRWPRAAPIFRPASGNCSAWRALCCGVRRYL